MALSAASHERGVSKPRRRSVTRPLPTLDPDSGSGPLLRPLLTVTAVAGVMHLGFALVLLRLLGATEGGHGSAARPAALAVVLLTAAVALLSSLRSRGHGLDRLVRTAPAIFGLLPPIASLLGLPLFLLISSEGASEGISVLEGSLPLAVAVLAATSAPGLLVALALEQIGSTFAARGRLGPTSGAAPPPPRSRGQGDAHGDRAQRFAPPSLADRLVRQAAGLILASGLLMLAHVMLEGVEIPTWENSERSLLAAAATATTLALILLSAASAGRSPGRDVRALAHRLDAIGWEDSRSARRPLASPVRLTSFDAVGELFRNLEQLRARLAEDVDTYQGALDRTHEADTAKGEFLAAVSHELRTPLNSIMGFAQILLETDLNESQIEDIRLILAGGRQLHELIADILDLSMIESGELDLRLESCDLGVLVEELVGMHQAQVHDCQIELIAAVAPDLPPVICDRRRIAQVLTNLMSNAIKFTEAGSVTVRVWPERGEIVGIEVVDTGVGIAQAELSGIFEEYRQAGERKRKTKGTGLGLAIARRIAQAHGGYLEAESRIEEGSTFRLRLPHDAREHVAASASRSAVALSVVRAYTKNRRGSRKHSRSGGRPS